MNKPYLALTTEIYKLAEQDHLLHVWRGENDHLNLSMRIDGEAVRLALISKTALTLQTKALAKGAAERRGCPEAANSAKSNAIHRLGCPKSDILRQGLRLRFRDYLVEMLRETLAAYVADVLVHPEVARPTLAPLRLCSRAGGRRLRATSPRLVRLNSPRPSLEIETLPCRHDRNRTVG